MKMHKNHITDPQNGALTTAMNVNDNAFKALQVFLQKEAASLDENQKNDIALYALKLEIEEYLNYHEDPETIISVGAFLKRYLEKLKVKQIDFANYIGLDATYFNKILKGKRKITFELSFLLSQLFDLDPKTWMLIQLKNEYLALKQEKADYFTSFSLDELRKKAS